MRANLKCNHSQRVLMFAIKDVNSTMNEKVTAFAILSQLTIQKDIRVGILFR